MRKWFVCLGLAGAVSACGLEAGYEVDSGTFGNATLNNVQMMNGERSYAQTLADRFAREVPTQINFAFDSAQLDAAAQQTLTLQADWIRQFPEVRFRVYGHTDAVGSSGYNKSLGMRRAQAVVSFFASRGISRSRLEAVVSYGETQPLVPTSDRERRNRRTVTQVSGFVDKHQNILDGKYAQVIYREYIKSAEPKTSVKIEATSSAFEQ
ncbi:OmpA family protein [Ruegeria sp. PrR005]|uniref:OmpA family protein n=1 Tax=Ruegeria sp. PrR005 TaxID=2706882 RepID=A0A6B2NRE1_9RHOB|nr:OmpA family protein [Ruegeria sp. PrR005]NDW44904.1 OmpA family protein [Ruegeria sp. PrR005]